MTVQLSSSCPVSNLPPPHDPKERRPIAWVGGWEVRQFEPGDARLSYFRARGFHHLQLWHPIACISILTPSRLTGGMFEVWPEGGVRFAVRSWRDVRARLAMDDLPGPTEILAIESWFIAREEPRALRLLRLWWRRDDAS